MPKPQPTILNTKTNEYIRRDILLGETITVLTYNDQIVSVRDTNELTGLTTYKNTRSTQAGFIKRLARLLNEEFETNAFSTKELK